MKFKNIFKMLKFGGQWKQMLVMTILFPIMGYIFEVSLIVDLFRFSADPAAFNSVAGNWVFKRWGYEPGFYFGISFVYLYTVMKTLCASKAVGASPLKKAISTKVPTKISMLVAVIVNTGFVAIQIAVTLVFRAKYPDPTPLQSELLEMFYVWMLMAVINYLFVYVYLGFAVTRYYIPAMICIFAVEAGWLVVAGQTGMQPVRDYVYGGLLNAFGSVGAHVAVFAGSYLILFLSGLINYLINKAMYRKPMLGFMSRLYIRGNV